MMKWKVDLNPKWKRMELMGAVFGCGQCLLVALSAPFFHQLFRFDVNNNVLFYDVWRIGLPYVTAAFMNNLNEPPRWNIQPNPREGGVGAEDGNKWNYALLLPLLGLAAFRELTTKILDNPNPNSWVNASDRHVKAKFSLSALHFVI